MPNAIHRWTLTGHRIKRSIDRAQDDHEKTQDTRDENLACHCLGFDLGYLVIRSGLSPDTLRTRLQADPGQLKGSLRDCCRKTIQHEGLRGLYKGFLPPVLSRGFEKAVVWTVYTATEETLGQHVTNVNPILTAASAGSVAGAVNSFIITPVEFIRNRLQMQYDVVHGTSTSSRTSVIRELVQDVVQGHGWSTFYRALFPTIAREILGVGFFFATYEASLEFLMQRRPQSRDSKSIVLASGSFAGVCYWIMALPFDTIKTLMTQQHDHPVNQHVRQVVQIIYRQDGIKGFYRGWNAAFCRAIPSAGMAMYTYHHALDYLQS